MDSWRIAALVLAVLYAIGLTAILITSFGSPVLTAILLINTSYAACIVLLIVSSLKGARTFEPLFVGIVSAIIYNVVILLLLPLLALHFVNAGPNPIATYTPIPTSVNQSTPTLAGGIAYLITPRFPLPFSSSLGGIGGFRIYFNYLASASSQLYLSSVPILIPEWVHLVIVSVAAIILIFLFQILLKRLFAPRMRFAASGNRGVLYSALLMGALTFVGLGLYFGLFVYVVLLLVSDRFSIKS